jgi:hypothetical protein
MMCVCVCVCTFIPGEGDALEDDTIGIHAFSETRCHKLVGVSSVLN